VVDTTAPSVTAPDSITIEASGAEGNLADIGLGSGSDTVEIISVTSDSPDTFPLGETVITWTATDSSGNSATATQTVTVVDTTAPELIVPENVIVDSFSLENLVEIGDADALDLVDVSPTITNDAPETFPLGDTIVTWNVADSFGNSNSFQQVVSVHACGQSLSDYNQILGTSEDDILLGTDASDLIFALGGNDIIFGGEGNDCIIGGEGYDIIKGDSGDDKLIGGPGFDIIDGGDDHDTSYDSASDIVIKCEEEL
jgi:Ca2+-binding RTX toxin-like protein